MYLNCKTYFSLRYGTYATEELVRAAADMGITTLAITNINNCCDAWDFYSHCNEYKVKPILGAEIRNKSRICYILLAANIEGFEWINEWISMHIQAGIPFPETTSGQHLFENPGDGFVIYPFSSKQPQELLPNEFIGVRTEDITKLFSYPVSSFGHKLIVLHPVSFQDKKNFNAHRLLRAIDNNVLLSKLPLEEQGSENEVMLPPSRVLEAFSRYPFIVTNTYRLADECKLTMQLKTDKNKKTFSATADDDRILLAKLAVDGCVIRYGKRNKAAMDRVRKELGIINDLGFNAYFLITWDIIRYAQSRSYYYVGRGSGANSIVAYCLQITDVDPIELDLYFERFLNPYRSSPPDFDIDFSWLDRDDVIDYVFKRYGKKQVALLGMITTFQYNALIRELGKVFGLPKAEIDQLAVKGYYSRNTKFEPARAEDSIQSLILTYGKQLVNFPNHLSIHPGGMLISEEPIHQYTPVYMPPKGFPTTQIDMFVAENIGLHKLDILSQRGLGHIKEALRIIRENRQVSVNIHDIELFKTDRKVKEQIRSVNTIGCFYIESPAMRQLLKKLECDDYLTLVAASSIIRPGVASSGMMKAYIHRFHNPDAFEYIHPVMKELLEETYGVMVYQEDVIKVAHHFAGLDMGEADILRRAMSGKYRGTKEMDRIRTKFFVNCESRAYPPEISREVWRQIESFGGYSFSKAHSASFAVESYQSLYLKTYFPKEFMVAVINNFGGFYSRELYFYELHKTGACIHSPCVNHSDWTTNIKGNDVYTGFIHIKSLEQAVAGQLIDERKRNGPYLHLQDLIERTGIGKEALNILIRINAIGFTGKSKKQLLWQANFLQSGKRESISAGPVLFHEPTVHFELPQLPEYPLEDLYDQMELLGFPLHNPFPMADDDPTRYTPAEQISNFHGQMIKMLGYLITYKPVRTSKGDTMCFGTFMDVSLNWIDTIHFPDSLATYPLNGNGFYRMTGKVVEDFGVFNLEVHEMHKVGLKKEHNYPNMPVNIERHIAHVDLDAFFVSVECLRNPVLTDKPLIVGGSGDRGVVAACSYEARRFGIHSAMPMKLARRLCPQAIIISGDMEDYSRYSKMVTEIIADKVPLFEKSSIDEFYIDLSGMDRFHGCSIFTAELKKTIRKESGLPVSWALAGNKLVSKVATNEIKPNGQLEVPNGQEKNYLAPLRIGKIPGIGKETSELLVRMGVETVKTLSEIPTVMLHNLLGKTGLELSRRANGIDDSPVIPYREQKSISTEQTFSNDTIDIQFLNSQLVRMTETIAFELRKQNKLTGCVTVKLRYANFDTVTRQSSIRYTNADHVLLTAAQHLFTQLYDRRMLVRLIGIRFTQLIPGNYQISLFDDTEEMISLYQAIDSVKKQFGERMLKRASAF